jgi:hypothetical protein
MILERIKQLAIISVTIAFWVVMPIPMGAVYAISFILIGWWLGGWMDHVGDIARMERAVEQKIESQNLDSTPAYREVDWDEFGKAVDNYLEVGSKEHPDLHPAEIPVPVEDIIYRLERDMSVTWPANLPWECKGCHHLFSCPMDPCPLCDRKLEEIDRIPPQSHIASEIDRKREMLEHGERSAGVGPAQLTFAIHQDLDITAADLDAASRMTYEAAVRFLNDRYPGMLKITRKTNPFMRDLSIYNVTPADPIDDTDARYTVETGYATRIKRRSAASAEDWIVMAVGAGLISKSEARALLWAAPIVPPSVAVTAGADSGEQHEDRGDDADDRRQTDHDAQPVDERGEQDGDENSDHGGGPPGLT